MAIVPHEEKVPVGSEFLKLAWNLEDRCETETDKWLPDAGVKLPRCIEALGTVLSLLDRLASCWWGCRGGDHVEEYLLGRAVSNARGALGLLRLGFYDEALTIIRAIGENANLLALFAFSAQSRESWRSIDDEQRKRQFSPVKVRLKLENIDAIIPMKEETYSKLCEAFTHVNPRTKPQSHNPLGMPTLGGHFQEAGTIVTLNELASIMVSIAGAGTILLAPSSEREAFAGGIEQLAEAIGAIDLKHIPDYWDKIQKELESLVKGRQEATRRLNDQH